MLSRALLSCLSLAAITNADFWDQHYSWPAWPGRYTTTSVPVSAPTSTTTVFFPAAATATVSSDPTTLPLHKNSSNPYLGSSVEVPVTSPTVVCVVHPLGWGQDDSSQILAAVERCGVNGVIRLPAPFVYTIARRMYMKLQNARFELFGTFAFTPDLLYWINNSFRIEFQNQSTAWIIEGQNAIIDGGGWAQGGIDGGGQAWMTRAQGRSNQFGRPITLSIYNSSNVSITNFAIRQPQFWSFWVQDSSDVQYTGIYINGTNTDPAGNGSNYEVNIDGIDSLRTDRLNLADWVFHGGDDCFAPKGNSTNITLRNMTCVGGGIAFGSVGQYPGFPDYIQNVIATDISVSQDIRPETGGAKVSAGAYFKSWVGVAEGVPPQGGGGGTGRVSNISFSGLQVANTTQAIYINKCYYKVADQANYCDTSTLQFEELSFSAVHGFVSTSVGVALNCSAAAPCHDITLQDISLVGPNNVATNVTCDNVENLIGAVCNTTLV